MAKSSSRLGRGLGSLIAGGMASKELTAPDNSAATLSGGLAVSTESILKPSNLEDASIEPEKGSENLYEIPIDSLVPNPYQPRKVIEPEAVRELAASIESEGLLQPVVVRKVGENYELVAGERRWRAHQHLGRNSILVRLLKASDISSASLSLIENLQREGLNPIEEALGFYSLVHEFNLTQAKVAERVGKSRAYVTNFLRLLQLDEELKVLLSSRKLSIGHAKVLLGLEDEKTRNMLGKKAAMEGWTVRQCEQAVDEIRNPEKFTRSTMSTIPQPFSNLAKVAQSSLKRKVAIKSDSLGKGKMSLSFHDESDLVQLLEKLGVTI